MGNWIREVEEFCTGEQKNLLHGFRKKKPPISNGKRG